MIQFFRRHVLPNLGLKLISLALAVGLWLAVAREPIAEVAVDVPIEFHDLPPNLEISSESIPKAQIRLRGPQREVHRLEPADVYAEIELEGLRPGERSFDLTSRQIHKPSDLQVVQVVPSEIHLSFDVREARDVPVQPRVVGTFVEGYQIGKVLTDPSTVRITGPRKRVEAVDSATVDPVDVSGAMGRATWVRHAYVSDPLVQVSSTDPIRITVLMEKASQVERH
jgi:diadenylate cyclase